MYKQPTSDEYDLELIIAKREATIKGYASEGDDSRQGEFITEENEFITRADFFKDLKKASQRIEKAKPSPKSS